MRKSGHADATSSSPSPDDEESVARIGRILKRRFGADYAIHLERSSAAALATLRNLRDDGKDVALGLAAHRMSGMTGTELLAEAAI